MAYFLFKCWHERLFKLERKDVCPRSASIKLEMIPITDENVNLVGELRGREYIPQFEYQLAQGDLGYYAYHEGRTVGYGWVKRKGSEDFFFEISDGCVYLCRFFVRESMRGKGIYPDMITKLIEHENGVDTFYIAVERGNRSSERGLKKVGFEFVKEYGFIRGFKHTFNKKKLTK